MEKRIIFKTIKFVGMFLFVIGILFNIIIGIKSLYETSGNNMILLIISLLLIFIGALIEKIGNDYLVMYENVEEGE